MAKAKDKDKDKDRAKKKVRDHSAPGLTGDPAAQTAHHAAKAHGRPSTVDTSLPATRSELLALHAEARRRRNAAALGSEDFRAAIQALERIEVRIAAIDRAADPPLG
ncbi:MAG TPA: hypothetical protein VGJ71_06835 [Candidatus Limnocylindrales bacterium]